MFCLTHRLQIKVTCLDSKPHYCSSIRHLAGEESLFVISKIYPNAKRNLPIDCKEKRRKSVLGFVDIATIDAVKKINNYA